jgi:pseudouridine-5'-phosphate glycosidase
VTEVEPLSWVTTSAITSAAAPPVTGAIELGRTVIIGVPVVTFGQDEFPSFYSSKSGYKSPLRLDSPEEIAQLLASKWDLQINGAVLIANPIPADFEMEQALIEKKIVIALEEADKLAITGKDVTPFLLKFIATNTQGESLEANIALIKNNAKIASEIAVALYKK